ncbi:MAG: gamma-glutamyltransferase family protein, partial [Methylophilaceae bacterium]
MRHLPNNYIGYLLFALALSACAHQPNATKPASSKFIVASADNRATQAGIAVLKNGGDAVDAAIAVQSVLSLVEPQSSGVGGGAFMLYYDASTKQLHSFDGRETAPASIQPNTFLDADGKPKHYFDAAFGGQAVGVPGVMALLDKTHKQFGNLPWGGLFADAEQMAEQGFAVSPRLSNWLQRFPNKGAHPTMLDYFYDKAGKARPAGFILKNPAYAETMRTTAKEGAQTYYTGAIAKQIVAAVSTSPITPRKLTLEDLANYKAIERQAVCAPYHAYKVCSMAPPTSGGIFMLQVLGLLETFNLKQEAPFSDKAIHLIIEASRLAYADRQQFIADPDFITVPTKS